LKFNLIYFFLLLSISVNAQKGIVFRDISLEGALQLAKEEKKNVFIDTYADWCIPCKRMEVEFNKPDIANLFNESYINVRINMDYSVYADKYKKMYDVVFLPTMILLDAHGNIKYKTDKIIPGDELLSIAKKSLSANVYFQSESTDIIRSPMDVGSNSRTASPTVIVHTLGSPNQNPDIMMKEAYFRIELMDGSHRKTASNYLETQTDWSIKKNLRFILDFLYTTKSTEFSYLKSNLALFKKELGEFEVQQTLSILINEELQNGYPRPDYEQAKELFILLEDATAEEETMKYFMERYLDECNLGAFKKIALEYLQKYTTNSSSVYAALGLECIENKGKNQDLDYCINHTKKAIEIENKVYFYYEQLAKLYMLKKDKKSAQKSIDKALELAKLSNHNLSYYQGLQKDINKL
jgi:thiol-disulfide isomerase/thioredoxin